MTWVYLPHEKQHRAGFFGNRRPRNMRGAFFVMVLASNLLGILAPVIIRHMTSEIQLKNGRVRGSLIEFPGSGKRKMSPTEAFYGLSYASLRDNNLRFQRPVDSYETWVGTKFLNESKLPCSQRQVNLSNIEEVTNVFPQGRLEHLSNIGLYTSRTVEDCLTLSLYKPHMRGKSGLKLYHDQGYWL